MASDPLEAGMPLPESREGILPSQSPAAPPNINRTLLEPLNHGMAAGTRKALELGIPTHLIIEMQLNHLASTVAMIEPAGARMAAIEDVVRQFSGLVRAHVDVRYRTPGGVLIPTGVPL